MISQHRFYVMPAGSKVGLTTVSLGLVRALDRQGVRVGFFKPVQQSRDEGSACDRSCQFVESITGFKPALPLSMNEAISYLREDNVDALQELVVQRFHESLAGSDVMVIEGLVPTADESYVSRLNKALVEALSAQVLLVAGLESGRIADMVASVEIAAAPFGGVKSKELVGAIINKIGLTAEGDIKPVSMHVKIAEGSGQHPIGDIEKATLNRVCEFIKHETGLFKPGHFDLLGVIPWNGELQARRVADVARALDARIVSGSHLGQRRYQSIAVCARGVSRVIDAFHPQTLLVLPPDRDDLMITISMALINKIPLAGMILAGDYPADPKVFEFSSAARGNDFPVLTVPLDSYSTATAIYGMSDEIPLDDLDRLNAALDYTARRIDTDWVKEHCRSHLEQRVSPAAFRYQLVQRARQLNKRIILPEGEEPRTIKAADACQRRGIARCVLIGDPEEIERVARAQGIVLDSGLEIINDKTVPGYYIDALLEFRKHKKLAREQAIEHMQDSVMLGTVMLALGEVDGLVSGAIHSSAHTVRPALQIIKTHVKARVASSIFFMCLPEQVVVYGDCAVVPDPDAETLADIAIQSAESAKQFGIEPRVAMISYSTGDSGSGVDVDKVRRATELAKKIRPDLLIDGPMQYDAAAIPEVAFKKAPGSPVAGRATVFVFPDLNTGNTTYKAVQRSAKVVSIGPMLQGLKKPVNDLSRGALVDDIIYTIALTSIQAGEVQD